MKRTLASVLVCTALLGTQMLAQPVHASDAKAETTVNTACISPAIRVLSAQTALKKNGAADQTISFSGEDFAAVLGYTPTEIVLTTLPDPMTGVLKLGGMTLAAGSRLSASVLQALRFVPTATEETAYPVSLVCLHP